MVNTFKQFAMLRPITTLIVLFFFISTSLFSQNYYYSPEGKATMEVSTSKLLVKFVEGTDFAAQQQFLSREARIQPLTADMLLPAPKISLVDLQNVGSADEVYDLINDLEAFPEVEYAGHFLLHEDGTLHGVQNLALVGLRSTKELASLEQMVQAFGGTVESQNEFDPLMYHVSVGTQARGNALELANELAESGLFDYAEPDFLRLMKRHNTNDTYVNNQWSLENDGNNTSTWGGIAGIDMSVFDAWGTTTGSGSISVAIIDEGVDLDHPDLLANMLPGYDATGQGSGGNPSGNDAHGTACAGIAAGVGNNGIGVAGVAYDSKIVPIRIAYSSGQNWVTNSTWIANGLNWAWQTGGADILSNSWGGGGVSSAINNAISGSITNGRGGLGAPVLFSAGNGNGSIGYPASNNNTIAVIATSMCGERKNPSSCDGETWWGSDYGTHGDVAAPGVKIYATDIAGSAGYSGGDYTATFNGTSSACPNAAGVMALILSANSALTETQARAILEGNCDKVGGYTYNSGVPGQPNGTWSNDLGYGLVNAHAAVLAAAPSSPDDAGISSVNSPKGNICNGSSAPQVVLNNYGSNTLSSVTINYQLDGGTVSTTSWSGSLASGSSTTVTLPTISYSGGSHTLNVYTSNPNGTSDTNTSNDDASSSFYYGNNSLTLTILTDNYPGETTWDVRDGGGNVLASGGPYGATGTTYVENICVADACFDFTIYDSYGDGICCTYGSGSYTLTEDASGSTLASGGSFGSLETTNFCVPTGGGGPTCNDGIQNGDETGVDCGGSSCPACAPTCSDGIQNGDETGVDCGGSSCPACAPTCGDGIQNGDETGVDCGGSCPPCSGGCTYVTINSNNFEGGWGIWNDGGSDCRRSSNDAAYALGTYCIRLRDNTSSSVMTTDNLDLSSYSELTVNFSYYPRSMDNSNEDFWLQVSTNGGSSYTTVEEWNLNDEFVNNTRYYESVVISGTFSANTRLRFRCDASGNSDWVYIDEVTISGCQGAGGNNAFPGEETEITKEPIEEAVIPTVLDQQIDWQVFPNPTSNVLNVRVQQSEANAVSLYVMDMTGKMVAFKDLQTLESNHQTQIPTDRLEPGVYIIQLLSENTRLTKKFVVAR